ncbi:hypothetical protein [Acinetobacter sp. MB5]|uniref:hypothetical protein n=1 Tax=Acinetobacter sp. MB5 TaxID=2069438 RepID=UPI000DD01FB6|nr:hypothetical protein [Acinetobacter sp. MB5]
MNRIYLYKIKTGKTIASLYDSFVKYSLENSKFTFAIETFNTDILEVRSFEKIKNRVNFTSPDGKKNVIEYETYQTILFSIFTHENASYLALHNPPRSVRSFFNVLSVIGGINYTIEEVALRLSKISEYFNQNYHCLINFVEFDKVSLNSKAYANIEVYSAENALDDFQVLIQKNDLDLNKISIVIKSIISETSITLNKKGLIQVKSYNLEFSLSGNEIFKYIKEILSINTN